LYKSEFTLSKKERCLAHVNQEQLFQIYAESK